MFEISHSKLSDMSFLCIVISFNTLFIILIDKFNNRLFFFAISIKLLGNIILFQSINLTNASNLSIIHDSLFLIH
ncbi:MAG: hypothetical protein Q8S84_04480 [bacterium]|nr:hypothetical protein [bacterium]MDP3380761.1 hypothetical protein [bacterium]